MTLEEKEELDKRLDAKTRHLIDEPQQVYYQCPTHPNVRVDIDAPNGYYEDRQYRCIFCHLYLVKKVVDANELP